MSNSNEANQMIENVMEYFDVYNRGRKSTCEEWKQLYNELSKETLCCKETDNIVLQRIKKILDKRQLMHLWTRENIFKIMALVKDEIINTVSIRTFIDRE